MQWPGVAGRRRHVGRRLECCATGRLAAICHFRTLKLRGEASVRQYDAPLSYLQVLEIAQEKSGSTHVRLLKAKPAPAVFKDPALLLDGLAAVGSRGLGQLAH